MIKYLISALLLLAAANSEAQNNRADTTLLGIYSTGAGFTLTRADFGTQTATDILTDMVMAYDTVQVSTTVTDTARSRVRQSYEKRCNTISGLVTNKRYYKDKIVLMELNKDCDVTQICLLAQRAGAKAFVFIHNSNSNGNIHLPKQGLYKDSIRIPIFTVGKEKGENISALLPSVAALKTKMPPPATQSLVKNDSLNSAMQLATLLTKTTDRTTVQNDPLLTTDASLNLREWEKGLSISKPYMKLSPNPTRDIAYINYGLPQSTDVQMDVKNAVGQVIFTQILRGVQIGTVELNTQGWANNIYIVEMRFGKETIRQKLVVQR